MGEYHKPLRCIILIGFAFYRLPSELLLGRLSCRVADRIFLQQNRVGSRHGGGGVGMYQVSIQRHLIFIARICSRCIRDERGSEGKVEEVGFGDD